MKSEGCSTRSKVLKTTFEGSNTRSEGSSTNFGRSRTMFGCSKNRFVCSSTRYLWSRTRSRGSILSTRFGARRRYLLAQARGLGFKEEAGGLEDKI